MLRKIAISIIPILAVILVIYSMLTNWFSISLTAGQEFWSMSSGARKNVVFADVVGQEDAQQALREAIIWPHKQPALLTGVRQPLRTILLYGLPGVGKTLLVRLRL